MVALRVVLCAVLLSSCELMAGIPNVRSESIDAAVGCESFCELANSLCTGEFAIYHGDQDCPTACKYFSAEDLECRENELQALAARDASASYLYCPNASLSGGNGVCGGSPCRNYCQMMAKVCSDFPEANVIYPIDGMQGDQCEQACSIIPDREKQRSESGFSTFDINGDHQGDTIQCRLVHLTMATRGESAASKQCEQAYISPRPVNGAAPWCAGR